MNRNLIETILGGLVLLVAFFFLYFAYTHSTVKTGNSGYVLTAKFDRADGLLTGSDVLMSGVKIGSVVDLKLDPTTYLAVVRFSVRKDVRLPMDTLAEIQMNGLLGDKYLSLVPGGDEIYLKDGEEIENTQSALNLTDLIGKAIFSKEDKNDTTEEEQPNDEKESHEPEAPTPETSLPESPRSDDSN